MTTEQILTVLQDNLPLRQIIEKTVEIKGHNFFDSGDLIKGIKAMEAQCEAEWQVALANRSEEYDNDNDNYSSIYPDNFWNE